ncbi:MAG: zf-HC2 domain-containing protein [Deltaproteobacteria bacterium]|nr:zf-HC2 domain-containing protein [Deltaproteobacteria bacterium]
MASIHTREMLMYLEGEVTQSRAVEIEEHLGSCGSCSKNLTELRDMCRLLGEPDDELAGIDLVADIQRIVESDEFSKSQTRKRWPVVTAILVFLSAIGSLAFILNVLGEDDEFRIKSAGSFVYEQDKWVGLKVFNIGSTGEPARLGTSIEKDDYLLFAYTNLGEKSFGYMMVFAVAFDGEVYWFHPAYTNEADDPVSIPIHKNIADFELAEKVRHNLSAGPLYIYSLFTREPLQVSKVEAFVKDIDPGERIPLKNSAQHILPTKVGP